MGRLATWPNLVTLVRLSCLPVFLWLLFSREQREAAAWLLGALGATDWVDGWLARRLDQRSEFGAVFDPAVDRLLFIVGVGSIVIDGSVPGWFGWSVVAREMFVAALMLGGTALGMPRHRVIRNVSYRAARAGIITGVLLAIARISGETAPLLFTALNNQFFSTNMNAPMPSLPVVIFQFALSPYEEWQKLAWTGALLITVTVLALSILARSLTARKS